MTMTRAETNGIYRKELYESITDPMLLKASRLRLEGRVSEAEVLEASVLVEISKIKATYPEDEPESIDMSLL